MRKFLKRVAATALSVITMVSGLAISTGSASAATDTSSGQVIYTSVASSGYLPSLAGMSEAKTAKFSIKGDKGFCIDRNKLTTSGLANYKFEYVNPSSATYGKMRKAVYLYWGADCKTGNTAFLNAIKKSLNDHGFTGSYANADAIYTVMHFYLSLVKEGKTFPLKSAYYAQYDKVFNDIDTLVKSSKVTVPSSYYCYLAHPQNGSSQSLFMVAQNSVTITKKDSVSGKTLSGATFSVTYKPDGNYCKGTVKSIGSYTTGSNGTVKIYLPLGIYEIKETKPPVGYSSNSKSQTANLTGGTGAITKSVTFENDKLIKLQLQKTSANPEITNNNTCYSLEGAEYAIYTDKACTSYFGYIKTDKTGFGVYGGGVDSKGNHVGSDVANKTYYAKERKAPKGYKLDTTVYTFKDSGKTTVDGTAIYSFTCKDIPTNDPVTVVLQKQDAKTGQATTRLAGAEFTFKFYAGTYKTEAELNGVSATRTWIVKTNDKGITGLRDDFLVSGDEFYYATDSGNPALPLGTITIQESKAPENYELNPDLYIGQITEEGGLTWLTTNLLTPEGQLIVPESETVRGGLSIHKSSDDGVIEGLWFRITSDNGYTNDVATNAMGTINLEDLDIVNDNNEYVKYTIAELGLKDANGNYYIPKRYKVEEPKIITLKNDGTVTVSFNNSIDTVPLNIIKTADDNNVSGIYFKVTASTGKTYTVVTDDEGKASVAGLPVYDTEDNVITYTVEELGIKKDDGTFEVPTRYNKPSAKSVTLINGTTVLTSQTVKFSNTLKKGVAKIAKTSDDGVLKDIYFKVESDNGYSKIAKTGSTGILSIYSLQVYNENGEKIKYTVSELGFKQDDGTYKIPDYYFSEEPKTMTLTENTTTTVNFKNSHKRGSLNIEKSSSDGVIENIYFEVESLTDGFTYDKYVSTDANGKAKVDDMEVCTADGDVIQYQITELGFKQSDGTYKLPKKYKAQEPELFEFSIDDLTEGKIATYEYSCVNTVRTSDLAIRKTSEDKLRKDIAFSVTSSTGVDYGIKLTDKMGNISYGSLPVFDDDDNLIKYTVTELGFKQDDGTYKVPYRYDEPKEITVTLEYDVTREISITTPVEQYNTLKKGSLTINKTDNDGKAIEGAKFNLISKSTGEVFATVTTDANGKGFIDNVPQGEYSLEETQTIAGLNLLKEASDITISGDNASTLYYTFDVKETLAPILPITGGANAIGVMIGLSGLFVLAGASIITLFVKRRKNTEVES